MCCFGARHRRRRRHESWRFEAVSDAARNVNPRTLDEAFRRRFGGRSAAVHDCAEAVIDQCDVRTDLRRRPTTVRVLRAITSAFVMSPRVRSMTERNASVVRRNPPVSASG